MERLTALDLQVDSKVHVEAREARRFTSSVLRGVVLHAVTDDDFRGTFSGPMKGADGKDIPPTGKRFDVDFCTVARWGDDGQIIEKSLFYDLVSFMQQISLSQ
jgi:hypothetical protein